VKLTVKLLAPAPRVSDDRPHARSENRGNDSRSSTPVQVI
jgi:hypothetical protein